MDGEAGFVLVPSLVPRAIEKLLDYPPFRQSEELADLDPEERDDPTHVFAEFRRYLTSLPADSNSELDALAVLEDLASWGDLDVANFLATEVIENLERDTLVRLRTLMGTNLDAVVTDLEQRGAL